MYFLRESEFVVKDRNIKQIKDLRYVSKSGLKYLQGVKERGIEMLQFKSRSNHLRIVQYFRFLLFRTQQKKWGTIVIDPFVYFCAKYTIFPFRYFSVARKVAIVIFSKKQLWTDLLHL